MSGSVTNKVPGDVPAIGRMAHEAKKFRTELKTKTTVELKELLTRQTSILSNSRLLASLKDRGEKVRARKLMLEEILKVREAQVQDAERLLAQMTIGKDEAEQMEWRLGGANLMNKFGRIIRTKKDSDDEIEDEIEEEAVDKKCESVKNPLKLLAQRSEVPLKKKQPHPEATGGRGKEDLEEEDDDDEEEAVYAIGLSSKFDQITKSSRSNLDSRFAPFKSVINETLTDEQKAKIPLKHRQDHSLNQPQGQPATPNKVKVELMPLPSEKYSCLRVKAVDLQESLQLQKQHAQRVREVQMKQAMERLAKSGAGGHKIGGLPPSMDQAQKMAYRLPANDDDDDATSSHSDEDDDDECSDNQAHGDEDDEAKEGCQVRFTITEYGGEGDS